MTCESEFYSNMRLGACGLCILSRASHKAILDYLSSAGFETTFEEFKKEANLVRVTLREGHAGELIFAHCVLVTARFPA